MMDSITAEVFAPAGVIARSLTFQREPQRIQRSSTGANGEGPANRLELHSIFRKTVHLHGDSQAMSTIKLSNGRVAIVDPGDVLTVSRYRWYMQAGGAHGYAFTRTRGRRLVMHRLIMGEPEPGFEIDHINGDCLDNRRANLRVCTHTQNLWNSGVRQGKQSSRFKGVYWDKKRETWLSRIRVSHKGYYLGLFAAEEDAAAAYDQAAAQLRGEFVRPNSPGPDASPNPRPPRRRGPKPGTGAFYGEPDKNGRRRLPALHPLGGPQ